MAAKFVFTKSSVTYRPPVGYYGKYGVAEKSVKGATDSPDIIEIDEEEDDLIIDDVSNRPRPLKKPKKGFIQNKVIADDDNDASQLFIDDDLEMDQKTINNNVQKSYRNVDSRDNVGGWGYEINAFSHFGPDLSSPGLTLVPTGIIKPRNLLKKAVKT